MRKVLWLGRATSTTVGLAILLTLVIGVASAAFGGNGGNFLLGRKNVATLLTKLGGEKGANGAMLEVQNNNVDPDDTALRLKVQPGEPPMAVNSSAMVQNLNVDLVDGFSASAFLKNSVYRTEAPSDQGTTLGDGSKVKTMSCLPGDRLLTGGPASVNAASRVLDSFPLSDTNTWQARINDSAVSGGDTFTVVILCIDQ
jgi:hypothetical protein